LRSLRRGARRWLLETPALFLAALLVPLLPRGLILAIARGVGRLAYALARNSRRIALANLQIAFGDEMPDERKSAVARESFVVAMRVLLDLFWFSRWTYRRLDRWTRLDDKLRGMFVDNQQIVVSAHFGNWEVMSLMLPTGGGRGVVVAKPIKNPIADRFINRIRGKTGLGIVPAHGALRRLLREIREGGSPALILDQATPPEEGGVYLDFFGLPASISSAAALLSQRAGIPVRPLFCRLEADNCYRSYCLPAISPAEGESLQVFSSRIVAELEAEIRRHPQCWMWMYKRWKRIPDGRSADGYPFYASKQDHQLPVA